MFIKYYRDNFEAYEMDRAGNMYGRGEYQNTLVGKYQMRRPFGRRLLNSITALKRVLKIWL